ncbi:MAG: serine/threonine protein kinase [Deltaproteobacteria bacterium]|jgi:serine/threonine-protein kinase|nr:serine/threonine protein kinase [Deltaproteobacteria bacterium]MBW2534272.1 serine/threonine protein kinase [Deltaproteobacteria bacterium]
MAHKPGDVIDDRYEILGKVGVGGHGTVYRARDRDLDGIVALKVLHGSFARSAAFTKRMQREARAMGKLAGTCAAQIMGFHKGPDGGAYLVMEYLDGEDLNHHLIRVEQDGGRLPIADVLDILGPIASTLEAGHVRGVIHRDVKLGNIFLLRNRARGRVRLLDYGLVKDLKASLITMPGTVPGSPAYIAPEAWRGDPDEINHRVDVYSLGVVVFRVVGGSFPFAPNRPVHEVIEEVTEGPRPSLAALRSDLDPRIDEWVDKALAIAPDERFQSVQALWFVLQDLLAPAQ